jgi:hypothetical protein
MVGSRRHKAVFQHTNEMKAKKSIKITGTVSTWIVQNEKMNIGDQFPKNLSIMMEGKCFFLKGEIIEITDNQNFDTVVSIMCETDKDGFVPLGQYGLGPYAQMICNKLVITRNDARLVGEMTNAIADKAKAIEEKYTGCLAAGGRSEYWLGSIDGIKWYDIGPEPSTRLVQNDRPTGYEKTGDFRQESTDRGLKGWKRFNFVLHTQKWDTINSCGIDAKIYTVSKHKTSNARRARRLSEFKV